MKKYSSPRPRDGQLKSQWGKIGDDCPDLCYAWGEGVSPADARLLDYAFTGKRYSPIHLRFDDSFIDELKARGYDITTLKFSIEKLKGEV